MGGSVERLLRAADRFQQRHSFLAMPVGVVKKFDDDQAGKHAALLAYYSFLSLFPLLLVFATLLAYALARNPRLQQEIIDAAAAQFPILGTQVQGSIRTIQGSGIGLVVGILGSLLLNLMLIAVMFQVLTGRWVAWRRLLPGAAFGAVGWSVLQTLGVYVLDRQLQQANLIYGVFAVVIVLLSWLYLSARLLSRGGRPPSRPVGGHGGGSNSAESSSAGSGSLRISTSSRPSDWIRSSRWCSEDWSWSGPCRTVSTGSTVAVRPSNAATSESLSRPLIRIS